jgi:hypothetical protein
MGRVINNNARGDFLSGGGNDSLPLSSPPPALKNRI